MKYILDAACMQTRNEAQEYLKKVLELPEYYGKNLDALYDCVNEMETPEIEICNMTEENKYAGRIIKVLKNAGANVVF